VSQDSNLSCHPDDFTLDLQLTVYLSQGYYRKGRIRVVQQGTWHKMPTESAHNSTEASSKIPLTSNNLVYCLWIYPTTESRYRTETKRQTICDSSENTILQVLAYRVTYTTVYLYSWQRFVQDLLDTAKAIEITKQKVNLNLGKNILYSDLALYLDEASNSVHNRSKYVNMVIETVEKCWRQHHKLAKFRIKVHHYCNRSTMNWWYSGT